MISSKEKNRAGKGNEKNDANFEKIIRKGFSRSWHWRKDLREKRMHSCRSEAF